MSDALWDEIQQRYGFTAPNPFERGDFAGPVGGFWVAVDSARKPVGSVAVTPLDPAAAELDVMYEAPEHRRAGVARLLLAALESHCRSARVGVLRLRAGEPQPEALRFLHGGRIRSDPTVRQMGRRRHGAMLREVSHLALLAALAAEPPVRESIRAEPDPGDLGAGQAELR